MNTNPQQVRTSAIKEASPREGSDEQTIAGFATTPEAAPPVSVMIKEVEDAMTTASDFMVRMDDADDTTLAQWDGQSDAGRKYAENLGEPAFPWEGASDTRVRMADQIIRENVARCKAIYTRSKPQAVPRETGDVGKAAKSTIVLDYVVRTLMGSEARDEVELASQWQQNYGFSLVNVCWHRQRALEERRITIEQMEEMAAQAGIQKAQQEGAETEAQVMAVINDAIADVRATIRDPQNEDSTVEVISAQMPDLEEREVRRIIRDLRKSDEATFHIPYNREDRPRWRALRPMVDVFFPAGTHDIQRAAWLCEVEWLTEAELDDRATVHGWDGDWVEEVKKHKGKAAWDSNLDARITNRTSTLSYEAREDDYSQLYQILNFYQRVNSADDKAAGLYRTVIHYSVPDLWGHHGLLGYDHGEYPFIVFRQEKRKRPLIECRGVPEIVRTAQQEVKIQRDSRTDRTSISTLPPLEVPANRTFGAFTFGPGKQIPTRNKGEVSWMNPPKFDQGSLEIEQSARSEVDTYYGRPMDTVPPDIASLIQQDSADDFIASMTQLYTMTFQLLQQYMPDIQAARITGGGMLEPFQVSRDEIQGRYDLIIQFDVRDLNTEFVIEKAKAVAEIIVPLDTAAVFDRAAFVRQAIAGLFPGMADQLVMQPQQAAQKDIDEEKQAVAMMSAGVEPPLIPGQNHQLRLQVLEETVNSNPQLVERLKQDEIFNALVTNRVKFHQFQIDQQENAQIGRVGTGQVLGGNQQQGAMG